MRPADYAARRAAAESRRPGAVDGVDPAGQRPRAATAGNRLLGPASATFRSRSSRSLVAHRGSASESGLSGGDGQFGSARLLSRSMPGCSKKATRPDHSWSKVAAPSSPDRARSRLCPGGGGSRPSRRQARIRHRMRRPAGAAWRSRRPAGAAWRSRRPAGARWRCWAGVGVGWAQLGALGLTRGIQARIRHRMRRPAGARWRSRRPAGARWRSRRPAGARWRSRRPAGAAWRSRRPAGPAERLFVAGTARRPARVEAWRPSPTSTRPVPAKRRRRRRLATRGPLEGCASLPASNPLQRGCRQDRPSSRSWPARRPVPGSSSPARSCWRS